MLDEATKTALAENSGSILGLLSAGAAAFWGLWKVLPVFNGNLDTAAKSASIHNTMLTTLIAERDAAVKQLEELRHKYEEVFRSEAEMRAKLAVYQEKCEAMRAQLEESKRLIESMHAHVNNATQFIAAASAPGSPIKEGGSHE